MLVKWIPNVRIYLQLAVVPDGRLFLSFARQGFNEDLSPREFQISKHARAGERKKKREGGRGNDLSDRSVATIAMRNGPGWEFVLVRDARVRVSRHATVRTGYTCVYARKMPRVRVRPRPTCVCYSVRKIEYR